MKRVVVVASTDTPNRITFTVVHRNEEILYGTVKCILFDDTPDHSTVKLDIKAECYERKPQSKLHGFTEKFYTNPEDYIWKYEERQNECIREVVIKAIPDSRIARIINI